LIPSISLHLQLRQLAEEEEEEVAVAVVAGVVVSWLKWRLPD
jgi:hypothetical protein